MHDVAPPMDLRHGSVALRRCAVPRPVGHEVTALGEQVAASIGLLNCAADSVRQGHFHHVIWVGGALGCPITEGRAEAVDSEFLPAHTLANLIHGAVIKGCSFLIAGKYEVAFAWQLR